MHFDSNPNMIAKEIEDVKDTQVCQFMCRTIYESLCKYFIHDLTMNNCILINTEEVDLCSKIAGGIVTKLEDCDPIFHSEDEKTGCLVMKIFWILKYQSLSHYNCEENELKMN